MKQGAAFSVFMVGLVMVMFGIGGVENSVETADLMTALAVCVLGLAVMGTGTRAMNINYYH